MNSISKHEIFGSSMPHDDLMQHKTGQRALSAPATLAGTWPAPNASTMSDLQHVYALDGVATSLNSLREDAAKSMKEADRALSQSSTAPQRLLSRLAQKIKDAANPVVARIASLNGSMAQLRP